MLCSPPDIALILGIAIVIFGPKRLPELGQSLGQGIGKFKKSLAETESSIRTEVSTASSLPRSSPDTSLSLATIPASGGRVEIPSTDCLSSITGLSFIEKRIPMEPSPIDAAGASNGE